MIKKAFTLIEIVAIVAVIGILVTLGINAYGNIIEDSKAKICDTNQQALKTALDIYAMEHDTLPGDLSMLPSEYIQKAFARIMQGRGAWKIKLAYFVVGLEDRGVAYAGLLTDYLARGNQKLLTCPKNTSGGISYGMNSALSNMSRADYRGLSSDTVLIADSNQATFTSSGGNCDNLAERHKIDNSNCALTVNSGGQTVRYGNGRSIGKYEHESRTAKQK